MSDNTSATTGMKGKNVGKHITGTREVWLAARLELLKKEKELTRRSDELALLRQQLPWVRIEKPYRFETDEGSASLANLFKGRSQLLVYHFMFGADYKAGCPNCSSIADGFNGNAIHLENHDVSFYAISRAPLEKLQAYKRRLGGPFPGLLRLVVTLIPILTSRSARNNSGTGASSIIISGSRHGMYRASETP